MSAEDFNLYSHFRVQIEKHAKDELLCTGDGRSYTYADIDERSASMASFLAGLGIEAGDRISVQVEKSPETLCLYLACLRAGF
ncbi:MAG: AMP-binding protein, partial [Gammaproteobacteria bacterium]|nr:AMP-binding protein [Gammaproteobacteria bacterium]